MKKIIAITIAAFALASCGIEELAEEVISVETTAPTTTAPTTDTRVTAPPVTAPPVTAAPAPAVGDCGNVNIEDTSTLIPDDWNQWCDGYLFAFEYAQTAEGPALCEEFWAREDVDILIELTSGPDALTRDEAIGMIDALWIVC